MLYPIDWFWIILITLFIWLIVGMVVASCKGPIEKETAVAVLLGIFWPIGLVVGLLYAIGYLIYVICFKTEETNKPLETKTQEYTNCPYCGHKLNSSLAVLKCENCGYITNGLPRRD